MKHSLYILLVLLLVSCGSSKKAVDQNNSKSEVEEITKTKIDSLKTIKEDVVVDDIEIKKVNTKRQYDSVHMIKGNFDKNKVKDSIGFKQKVKFTFEHSTLDYLLVKYVTERGRVDYEGFKSDHKLLSEYISSLKNNRPNDTWSKEEKLAYWINAYNALTIDLIIRNYPLKSIKNIDKPWNQRLWKFGDKWLNLNDIEHQILRKMDEPRIHFAIVCASETCSKLRNEAFTAEKLESQLTKATEEFLDDSNKNELSENNIKISKIFKWFAKDFKTDGTLIDFLNQYSKVKISGKAKKSYKDYSWDLND